MCANYKTEYESSWKRKKEKKRFSMWDLSVSVRQFCCLYLWCLHICCFPSSYLQRERLRFIHSSALRLIHNSIVSCVLRWLTRSLNKKLKFEQTNKYYKHNPESVQEDETHKILWDFEIQTDHLISARQPDLIIINKKEKTCRIVDCAVQADHRVKLRENEKRDKYLKLARELQKNCRRWKWRWYQL